MKNKIKLMGWKNNKINNKYQASQIQMETMNYL